ncbi:hypothetical protein AB6A40_005284 [Gnathostoma spinigerum]|uniref:Receptor-binding cancer antigen expressed on SiSo cells n=1 Tax=Gnathostoma spinigerum TaxID=75299 RepID=A0ABD6EEZ2_9BILA
MSLVQFVVKKVISFVHLLISCVKRVICFWHHRRSSDSLPLVVPAEERSYNAHFAMESVATNRTGKWDDWSEQPFTTIQDKIEEYRMKKDELATTSEVEPNFFGDMEPELKKTKKVYVGAKQDAQVDSTRNMFSVKETTNFSEFQTAELGELSDEGESAMNSWDADIDLGGVDSVLREQRRREAEEKQRARQKKRMERQNLQAS